MKYKKSYLTSLVLLVMLANAPGIQGQSIYLDPAVQYVTTGIGTEFDLELKVDAGITSLKSFVYYIDFDPTKLDTVSVTQGPLLPSSPAGPSGTMFGSYIVDDRLEVEDLILGAGIDVAGPGLVATIRFVVLDTGTIDLAVNYHRIRDVSGTLLTTDAYGAIVYVDVPPDPFELIVPFEGELISGLPGDDIQLSWMASQSPYPGESVEFTLQYSSIASFDPPYTTEIPGLTSTSTTIQVADLVEGYEGVYYWRVIATGDLNGFERISTPAYRSINFEYTHVPPESFDLLTPADNTEISGVVEVLYDWEDAATIIPGDNVNYMCYIGPDPGLPAGALIMTPATSSVVTVPIAGLPRNVPLYWMVRARNSYGQTTYSTSTFGITFLGCCIGRVGDANNTGDDEPTIGDVSSLIDLLFISGIPLECWAEGDINQSGGADPDRDDITIGDVSILIDYLFITGSSLGLPDCL